MDLKRGGNDFILSLKLGPISFSAESRGVSSIVRYSKKLLTSPVSFRGGGERRR